MKRRILKVAGVTLATAGRRRSCPTNGLYGEPKFYF